MDIPPRSPASNSFVTNVGLITTNGPNGYNIMPAEWTHHISYYPGFIAVALHPTDVSAENILKSKEFGVSIANENQNVLSSVAGHWHGQEVDKIAVLKEMGFEFYKAKKIDAMMVKGAAANIECKLVFQKEFSDHILFVGEAVEVEADENIRSILYKGGKYYKVGENILKPGQDFLDKIERIGEKYRKPSK
jgi:flavin reductase (DIM6/NTAB) family NADH-FMN oxidoreductase RutF